MKLRWLPAAWLCLGSAGQAQDDGKALLERACTKCHNLTATLRQRNSGERWSTIVDDMMARGAEASDAELEKIIDYLAKNFGPRILVNKASAAELAAGLGIPRSAAAGIVEYRRRNGAFKTLDDLKKVPSLDAADMERKQDRLDFSEAK